MLQKIVKSPSLSAKASGQLREENKSSLNIKTIGNHKIGFKITDNNRNSGKRLVENDY
jgi:hypothetical protein